MSASDLKSEANSARSAISGFAGGLSGDPIGYILYIGGLVVEAIGYLPRAATLASTPPGDPGAAGEASLRYKEASERADDISDSLAAIASGDIPDAVVGEAGNSLADVLNAFVLSVTSDSTGLMTASKAFSTYETDLTDAQTTHSGGASDIDAGVVYVQNIHPNLLLIANPVTAATEIRRILRALVRGLEMVLDGLEVCEAAYGMAVDAGLALRRRMSDSHGYARLTGIEIPSGQTSLDVLVARVASPSDDPDDAILSKNEWNNYVSEWEKLTDEERAALLAAMNDTDDPNVRALLMSALATGAGLAAVLALAAALKGMTPAQIAEIINLNVTDSASAGGEEFNQYNDKTCGATSLLMLAAQSDPFLAYWLATGEFADGHVPAYLNGFDLSQAGATAEERMAYVQQMVQYRANQVLGDFWWITAAGTMPGGAVNEASLTGTGYEIAWNKLAGVESDPSVALTEAAEAVNNGQPVPLLVGQTDGLVPMHYVLITGYHDGVYTIYEPYYGLTHNVPEATLLDGDANGEGGFGGWNEVFAVILPED